jgi:hypothetical protein
MLQPVTMATGQHGVLLQVPARDCPRALVPPSATR